MVFFWIWVEVEAYLRIRNGRIERVRAHVRRVWIKLRPHLDK